MGSRADFSRPSSFSQAVQVSSLPSRLLPPRASDEAHPNAYWREASRLHLPWVSRLGLVPFPSLFLPLPVLLSLDKPRWTNAFDPQLLTLDLDSCDKRFSRSDELTRHVRIHQTDRGRKKASQQAASNAASPATSPNTAARENMERAAMGRKIKGRDSRAATPDDDVSAVSFECSVWERSGSVYGMDWQATLGAGGLGERLERTRKLTFAFSLQDGSPEPPHHPQPGPYGPPMMGYVRLSTLRRRPLRPSGLLSPPTC